MVHIDLKIDFWTLDGKKVVYRDWDEVSIVIEESVGKDGVLIHLVSDEPHALGVSVTPQLWAVLNLLSILELKDRLSFIADEMGRIFMLPGVVSIDLAGVPEPPVV
jgi:hypothetical protein